MQGPNGAPTLVVVAGPIASGKSTVARALSTELRRREERVALVELDQIAEMALPTLPNWEAAHAIFNSVVGQWMRTALTCVVAEGPGTPAEVRRLLAQVPADASVVEVVLTSPFDIAFARAQADMTRGVSRERDFLTEVHRRWAEDLPRMEHDVLIDTSETSVDQSVGLIRTAITRCRA